MFYSCCIKPWNLQSRTYPSHICHHCMCKYFSKMAMFPVVELMWVTALSLLANFTKFPICACTALVAYMYSPSLPLTWQVLAMHVCKSRQENGWNPLFALRTVRLVKSCQQYSWPLANKITLYVSALIWQSCKISQIKLPTWLVTHHLVSGWGRGAVLSIILQSMSFPRLIWVLTFWEKCMNLMSLSPTANPLHSWQLDRSQYKLVFLFILYQKMQYKLWNHKYVSVKLFQFSLSRLLFTMKW